MASVSVHWQHTHTCIVHSAVTRSSVHLGGRWRGHWLSLLSGAQESGSEICGRQYYRTLGHLDTSQLLQLMPSSEQVYMCVWRESMCVCMNERRRREREANKVTLEGVWEFCDGWHWYRKGLTGLENRESVEIIFDLPMLHTCEKLWLCLMMWMCVCQHVCMCSASDVYSRVIQSKPIDHEHQLSSISLPLPPYTSASLGSFSNDGLLIKLLLVLLLKFCFVRICGWE